MAEKLLTAVVKDAEAWSVEGGLKPPFETHAEVKDFGYKVQVAEKQGSRMSTCTYLKTGARSMYELDKK